MPSSPQILGQCMKRPRQPSLSLWEDSLVETQTVHEHTSDSKPW